MTHERKITVVLLTLSFLLAGTFFARAFTGPSQGPPSGGGVIGTASNAAANAIYVSSTNVGIGTTTPASKLTVSGTGDALSLADAGKNLNFSAQNTKIRSSGGTLGINIDSGAPDVKIGSTGGFIYYQTSSGNVGIATTTPGEKLDVVGNVRTSGAFIGAISGALSAANVSSETFGRLQGNGNFSFPAALGIGTSSTAGLPTNGLFVSGSVGIGTAAPLGALDISSGAKTLVLGADNNLVTRTDNTSKVARIMVAHRLNAQAPMTILFTTGSQLNFGGGTSVGNVPTQIGFFTAPNDTTITGTEQMRITSAGNVGIGTTTPQHTLSISGAYYSAQVNKGTVTTATTVDWAAGNIQHMVLGAAGINLTFSNGKPGGRYTVILKQDATGNRTVNWPSDVRWSSGAPTLSTSPNYTDYIGFIYNGYDVKYDGIAINLGFY